MTKEAQSDIIRQQMADHTPGQIQEAIDRLSNGLNNTELNQHISSIKTEIKKRATSEELEEVFKHFRL